MHWLLLVVFISLVFNSTHIVASTLDLIDPLDVTVSRASSHDQKELQDPVTSFQVTYPKSGSVVKLPLKISLELGVTSIEHYTTRYSEMKACIEILETVTKCIPILDPEILIHELRSGLYTAKAFITDTEGDVRHHVTDTVSFSVVDGVSFAAYAAKLVEKSRKKLSSPKDLNLLEWAHEQHNQGPVAGALLSVNNSVPQLVIGVKTAVLTNFARRQAIRQTWGQRAQQLGVKVFFLGCVPIISDLFKEMDRKRLEDAIKMEKKVYQDLLTEELECEDSYRGLADKVKAFFHLAVITYSHTPYVMLTDDDIYLRLDKLINLLEELNETKRVYLGQAWNSLYSRKSVPVRDEFHQNYLPVDEYPLKVLPPYAFGPHYVVSMDCARFISKNYWNLRSLNGLEDVSVGLWMLTMQVHLRHMPQFAHVTLQPCKNNLISLAELSPLGVRAIHANLLQGSELCHDYDRIAWNVYQAPSTTEMLAAV